MPLPTPGEIHVNTTTTTTRRGFLAAAGALSVPALLAGCGFAPQPRSTSARKGTVAFTTWGTDAELAGFRAVIAAFQKANPGATVELNAVPYEQIFTNIDAQLQAGNPPDVFRVPYYSFGGYAGRGQLLDLSKRLPSGFSDRFTEAAWAAVQVGGTPYGVPHHTDTSAIYYNRKLLADAGVDVPTALERAWTWDQLEAVGDTLKASLPSGKYPWAYNWQGNGVTRWLSLLFQADGRFLKDDQKTAAIDSAAGRATVDFTKRFFERGYVPQNDSIKSSTYAQDTWSSETCAMVWGGAFAIPAAASSLKFDWGVTFAPRNKRGGSDFGGNALVATKQSKSPDLAAAFLDFATREAQMKQFCERASLLPTRKDLVGGGIEFAVRPELSKTFIGQASTVQAQDARQVASPSMSKIIPVLQNQLEQAFVGGQSTDATIRGLQDGIRQATSG